MNDLLSLFYTEQQEEPLTFLESLRKFFGKTYQWIIYCSGYNLYKLVQIVELPDGSRSMIFPDNNTIYTFKSRLAMDTWIELIVDKEKGIMFSFYSVDLTTGVYMMDGKHILYKDSTWEAGKIKPILFKKVDLQQLHSFAYPGMGGIPSDFTYYHTGDY